LMVQGSAPILYEGEVLGVTCSAGYGHTVGKTICYGYLPAEHHGTEDGFEIEIYRKVYAAKREPNRSLYDPKRKNILL
ncbi:MAG: hypothetical protein HKO68_14510, partial [Desulfobacterales bacterium]|nr:hypothetical protein [Desulfobacterales bacterium]